MSVRSIRYPTCNWYEPYCHMCSVRLYYNFPCYHTNGTIFEKCYRTLNVCFGFATTFSEIFLILRRI